MTADQVKGKGFKGALNYNLAKLEKGLATVLDHNFVAVELNAILKEVQLVKILRPNLQKYFYHTSLNFPPEENLPDEKIKKIAREYLDEMGFTQHQYIVFRHFDADHPHVHLLVNRIGYDGSVVSDSRDFFRSENVLRKLEKKHHLTPVISSKQAKERAMTKNELEMMKRTDEPSIKLKLQELIKQILKSNPDIEKFIHALESKGINVLFNQANTGFVSGISYGFEGIQMKGVQLGNAYKWQAIKTAIGYEQERDRTAIHQANLRTRAEANTANNSDGTDRVTVRKIAGGRDPQTVQRTANDAVQSTGNLRERIKAVHQEDSDGYGSAGAKNDSAGSANEPDGATGSSHQQSKQDRKSLVDSPILHFNLIEHLISSDDNVDRMGENALKTLEKKKKRKQQKPRW